MMACHLPSIINKFEGDTTPITINFPLSNGVYPASVSVRHDSPTFEIGSLAYNFSTGIGTFDLMPSSSVAPVRLMASATYADGTVASWQWLTVNVTETDEFVYTASRRFELELKEALIFDFQGNLNFQYNYQNEQQLIFDNMGVLILLKAFTDNQDLDLLAQGFLSAIYGLTDTETLEFDPIGIFSLLRIFDASNQDLTLDKTGYMTVTSPPEMPITTANMAKYQAVYSTIPMVEGYTGTLFTIKRLSDNATYAVTPVNGDIDKTAIDAWRAGADCVVPNGSTIPNQLVGVKSPTITSGFPTVVGDRPFITSNVYNDLETIFQAETVPQRLIRNTASKTAGIRINGGNAGHLSATASGISTANGLEMHLMMSPTNRKAPTSATGSVTSVTPTAGGSGYSSSLTRPILAYLQGGGVTDTVAQITPTVTSGAITAFTVNSGGTGYATATTIPLWISDTTGGGCLAYGVAPSGVITNVLPWYLDGTYNQSGTTVTVTKTAHGLTVGQQIYFFKVGGTGVSGLYIIASATANTFTYTAGTSLSITTSPSCTILAHTASSNGTGYSADATVVVIGGNKVGLIKCYQTAGAITSTKLVETERGYTSNPTVTIANPHGGTGATFSVTTNLLGDALGSDSRGEILLSYGASATNNATLKMFSTTGNTFAARRIATADGGLDQNANTDSYTMNANSLQILSWNIRECVKSVNYTQSGTTVTVNSPNHKLIGANNAVSITESTGGAITGQYTSVTVVDANTFTYTAGTSLTISGTLTYDPAKMRIHSFGATPTVGFSNGINGSAGGNYSTGNITANTNAGFQNQTLKIGAGISTTGTWGAGGTGNSNGDFVFGALIISETLTEAERRDLHGKMRLKAEPSLNLPKANLEALFSERLDFRDVDGSRLLMGKNGKLALQFNVSTPFGGFSPDFTYGATSNYLGLTGVKFNDDYNIANTFQSVTTGTASFDYWTQQNEGSYLVIGARDATGGAGYTGNLGDWFSIGTGNPPDQALSAKPVNNSFGAIWHHSQPAVLTKIADDLDPNGKTGVTAWNDQGMWQAGMKYFYPTAHGGLDEFQLLPSTRTVEGTSYPIGTLLHMELLEGTLNKYAHTPEMAFIGGNSINTPKNFDYVMCQIGTFKNGAGYDKGASQASRDANARTATVKSYVAPLTGLGAGDFDCSYARQIGTANNVHSVANSKWLKGVDGTNIKAHMAFIGVSEREWTESEILKIQANAFKLVN